MKSIKKIMLLSLTVRLITATTAPAVAAIINDVVRSTGGGAQAVAGPAPGGLQEGSTVYVDRNYGWQNIPEELLGIDCVMTYNDDEHPEGSDHSNHRSFYAIAASNAGGISSVPEPATIFLLGMGCLVLVRKPKH